MNGETFTGGAILAKVAFLRDMFAGISRNYSICCVDMNQKKLVDSIGYRHEVFIECIIRMSHGSRTR